MSGTFLFMANHLWCQVQLQVKIRDGIYRIEFWTKAVKLQCKIINFLFSKIATEAVYLMTIMKKRITWKNKLAKYMTVKLHSPSTKKTSIAYHQSEKQHLNQSIRSRLVVVQGEGEGVGGIGSLGQWMQTIDLGTDLQWDPAV